MPLAVVVAAGIAVNDGIVEVHAAITPARATRDIEGNGKLQEACEMGKNV